MTEVLESDLTNDLTLTNETDLKSINGSHFVKRIKGKFHKCNKNFKCSRCCANNNNKTWQKAIDRSHHHSRRNEIRSLISSNIVGDIDEINNIPMLDKCNNFGTTRAYAHSKYRK
jgi:hypothetical protein